MPSSFLDKSAFAPIRPFRGHKNRFFCMKNNCNALFLTEEKLANHKKFYHSKHPLADGDSSETLERIKREETEIGVETLKVERKVEMGEDKVYKTMVKMSSAFLVEFLRK